MYLHQISEEKTVGLDRSNASLEWISSQIIFGTYPKSHPHTELFGMVDPAYALDQTGVTPPELAGIERTIQEELLAHSEPYERQYTWYLAYRFGFLPIRLS